MTADVYIEDGSENPMRLESISEPKPVEIEVQLPFPSEDGFLPQSPHDRGGFKILDVLEERAGLLRSVSLFNGEMIAHIGEVRLILPSYLEEVLEPLAGSRVAILRVESGYRVRALV